MQFPEASLSRSWRSEKPCCAPVGHRCGVHDAPDGLVRDPEDRGKRAQAFTATRPAADLCVLRGRDEVLTAGMDGPCSSGTCRRRHREVGWKSSPPLLADSVTRCMELAGSTPVGSACLFDCYSF
jgi:hypothetical protein